MLILDVSFVLVFAITKLILKLWGELHRNKKEWERITPSPSESGQKGERLPEGKEAQKGPAADSGQREHHRSWGPGALWQETPAWGTGFRHRGQGQEGCTQSPKATWLPPSLLPFSASAAWSACPSAWGTIAPAAQCFPLTELLCLFLFFWRASSCWLPRVMLTAATLPFCTLSHFSFWTLFMLTTQIFLSHWHYTFGHQYHPAFSPEASFLSSVQSLSHVWLSATPWTTAWQASQSITNS